MTEDCSDLGELLATLHRETGSAARIWCVPAAGFETSVSTRHGVLLGGAWGPAFLRDITTWTPWGVPWTVRLTRARLALLESATAPLRSWLPLLEAVQKANEALLVVTNVIDRNFLQALTVNAIREALPCCAVRPVPGIHDDNGIVDDGPEVPPPTVKTLPLAAEAWIRRSATVLFPGEDAATIGRLVKLSVIAVGGENLEHQQQRLRYLARAVDDLQEF